MLAAAATRDSSLALVQLVLKSIYSAPRVEVSWPIKRHVLEVLLDASRIARDPAEIGPHTLTEAIELALVLRERQVLASEIEQAAGAGFENIQSELAKELVRSLESLAA